MNSILLILALVIGAGISLVVPEYGAPAVVWCVVLSSIALYIISLEKSNRTFLLPLFACGLLVRVLLATLTFVLQMDEFFGPDIPIYDNGGYALWQVWRGEAYFKETIVGITSDRSTTWGMVYMVAGIYSVLGRNLLAVQFTNAVLGAATVPVVFLCAHHVFGNLRVARISAFIVAFFPSLILWSSIAMKDAPIVFMLAVAMLATLRLRDELSVGYLVILIATLLGIFTFRFYIFYMVVAAIGGAFIIGMRQVTAQIFARQVVLLIAVGLAMTYFGVFRKATVQIESYANLEQVQRSRSYLSTAANSGFGEGEDVSTASGALRVMPKGFIYLLFAPFPWETGSLRQSITLPEMLIWYALFPMFILGVWFTIKYRLRQASPILLFTMMLTLVYSLTQSNVGTAYRQRAQLLIFYFIFVAVGIVLLKERNEEKRSPIAAGTPTLPVLQAQETERVIRR